MNSQAENIAMQFAHVIVQALTESRAGKRLKWTRHTQETPCRLLTHKLVPFVNTKSGRSRSVPVAPELFKEIQEHLKQYGGFSYPLSAFRRALEKSGIQLPAGQSAHVLRHTFAPVTCYEWR